MHLMIISAKSKSNQKCHNVDNLIQLDAVPPSWCLKKFGQLPGQVDMFNSETAHAELFNGRNTDHSGKLNQDTLL